MPYGHLNEMKIIDLACLNDS